VGRGLTAPTPHSAFGLEFLPFGLRIPPPPEKAWVPRAIKIAAKGSASLKRLKNTVSGYIFNKYEYTMD